MPNCIKNNSAHNAKIRDWIQCQWTRFTPWHFILLPLSWCFGVLAAIRRWLYKCRILKSYRLPVPVIVVGNINVGGTGKTPLVIWLAKQLKMVGFNPGIISRGYGVDLKNTVNVTADSDPTKVGDEPVLMASRAVCPVAVSPDRIAAARMLLSQYSDCNVIISDDGLQHYRMQRDVEVVVFDANKKFGNSALLPAGPLREPINRLKNVDAVVCNGGPTSSHGLPHSMNMQLVAENFYNLADPNQKVEAGYFKDKKLLAIAGIGNPQRFFEQLKALGLAFEARAFKDHHAYQVQDFENIAADAVIMTEKDAVKCKLFAKPNFWALPVEAVLDKGFLPTILAKLNQ